MDPWGVGAHALRVAPRVLGRELIAVIEQVGERSQVNYGARPYQCAGRAYTVEPRRKNGWAGASSQPNARLLSVSWGSGARQPRPSGR